MPTYIECPCCLENMHYADFAPELDNAVCNRCIEKHDKKIRAKVEAEIVAWLKTDEARDRFSIRACDEISDAIERGEHRKP